MDSIEAARQYLARGQAGEALDTLDDAGPDSYAHPDFWMLRGTALLDLGRPEDALTTSLRGLQSSPDNPELHYIRAHALQDSEKWIDSESAFESVLGLAPNHKHALADYAVNLAGRGHFERARALIDRLAKYHPDSLEYPVAEAFWHTAFGKRRAAVEWVQRALEINPDNPEAKMLARRLQMRVDQGGRSPEGHGSVTPNHPSEENVARTQKAAEAFETGPARFLAPGLRWNLWYLLGGTVVVLFFLVPVLGEGSALGALIMYGLVGAWMYAAVARLVAWSLNN